MSKTKFTKGEWFINELYSTFFQIDSKNGAVCVVDCSYSGGQDDMQICPTAGEEANAHLIKTAPKLYAMLNNISELANGDMNNLAEEMLCYFDDIEELLAEARGE